MLLADVIARVRVVAGDTNVLQYQDQDILNWVNDGVRECALQNNLLQKRASQSTTIGLADYDLPSDILKLHSVKFDDIKLQVLTLEEWNEQYNPAVDGTGTPIVCYVWAGKLTLYPTPESAKTLVIDYLYDPPFTDIGDIGATEVPLPVGYHQRIVDYCLAQVAQLDDDLQRYQLKMQEFLTGVQNLKDQPEWQYDLYPHMSVSSGDMGMGYYEW